jgi:hypothetical protein
MPIELINTTELPAFGFEHVLLKQRPYYIVIVKQSWQLMPGGGLRALEEPRAVRVSDQFVGEPNRSAISLPTDLVPYKPEAEVVLTGHAHQATPQTQWEVEVGLGTWSKRLRVLGQRSWSRKLLGWDLSDPLPSRQARLDYAGAYGGHFELPPAQPDQEPLVVWHAPNPGGSGWLGQGHGQALTAAQKAALKRLTEAGTVRAPCVEKPTWLQREHDPGRDVEPVGFGALPAWSPQRMDRLKGMKPIKPDQVGYPDDFNMAHWQQTAKDQWLPKEALPGGLLKLKGVLEEGEVSYRIPQPQALLYVRSPLVLASTLETDIDTLVIDTDARVLEVIERRLVSLELFGPDLSIEVLQRASSSSSSAAPSTASPPQGR